MGLAIWIIYSIKKHFEHRTWAFVAQTHKPAIKYSWSLKGPPNQSSRLKMISSSSCRVISTDILDSLSLAPSPYRTSLPAGPQGYTPNPHRAAVCRFELVVLFLLGRVKGSIEVHHLWARPYFSSSVLHV